MAMFLAEISFLLALGLFAAGLVLWHQGLQATSGLLRGAGAVLVVGAVLTALCTAYFAVRYQVQAEFDHAYVHASHPPIAAPAMMGPGGGRGAQPCMGPDMMTGQGMMGSRMMGSGMMEQGTQSTPMRPEERAPAPEPGHEEHHPEAEKKN